MDGNGRWAEGRGLRRTQGHQEGLKAAKRVVKAAAGLGIRYLTLYVFSTENWKRTSEEVGFIMGLVKQYLRGELDFYRENHIRIRHTGDSAGLPPDIHAELKAAIEETKDFGGLQVILALNYGGRDEIVRAVNRAIAAKNVTAKDATAKDATAKDAEVSFAPAFFAEITAEDITGFLDNPDVPDPDLIIRSAGELRTSNFLLWEGAYAEYYVSPVLWPDWTEDDLGLALASYQKRERKFGGIKP
ncbi:isoprenyl transferase [Spirochaetia bacterium]|nr:isoprenyl transferase [Spirochaetia bacterium]